MCRRKGEDIENDMCMCISRESCPFVFDEKPYQNLNAPRRWVPFTGKPCFGLVIEPGSQFAQDKVLRVDSPFSSAIVLNREATHFPRSLAIVRREGFAKRTEMEGTARVILPVCVCVFPETIFM